MNYARNTRAVTTAQIAVIVIILVVVGSIAAVSLSSPPQAAATQPITVFIEETEITANYSEPITLGWGSVVAGNTYTKNFTVKSNANQALTLKLYTTEPAGTALSWSKNGTQILAGAVVKSTLVYTLSESAMTGTCTWRLTAVNGTTVEPTPTPTTTPTPTASPEPTPTPTPIPLSLEFTIDGDVGVKNMTVTVNDAQAFTILPDALPKTYSFNSGDEFAFKANLKAGYTWNGWEPGDGGLPIMTNPYLTTKTGNFTLTAQTLPP